MKTTLYRIIGVGPGASIDEINAAYARSAKRAEASSTDPGPAALLKQALEVLSDPLRRNAYDAALAAEASGVAARGSRRSADPAPAMTPVSWLVIIGTLIAVIAAAVWIFSRHEAPKPIAP